MQIPDLKGKKVSTQNGSSSLDAINKDSEFVESLSGGAAILFDTYNDAFMDLEAKRSDALVADEVLVRYYLKERGTENEYLEQLHNKCTNQNTSQTG